VRRAALSLRGIATEYGIDRARVAVAVRSGELPASRLGRQRMLVLRSDVEEWLRRYRVTPERDRDAA
jgi:excisionase family DNA binding protein